MTAGELTPTSYKSAITGRGAQLWQESMDKEINSCEADKTWTLVKRDSLPANTSVLRCNWVYKIKTDVDGELAQRKSRITLDGRYQQFGINYNETFAHTGKYKTMRLGLSLAANQDLEIEQLDVPSAFLKAELDEHVYMELPQGYGKPGYVVRLLKSLYGLKQAPRNWYLMCSKFIISMGYKATISDPCLFYKRSKSGRIMLLFLFVDDMQGIYNKTDAAEWNEVKLKLKDEYNIKDLGETKFFLGMCITRNRIKKTIKISQELYVEQALERFNMTKCKPARTPEIKGDYSTVGTKGDGGDGFTPHKQYMELVGTLLYAAITTRPDISHAVHNLTQHMQNPQHRHRVAANRVLQYLSGTRTDGITFGGHSTDTTNAITEAYTDADWATCKSTRKSVTGWAVKVNGDLISWTSKKQSVVALSSCEAELYAESAAIQEIIWQRAMLQELGFDQSKPSIIHEDNQSTITISKNGIKNDRTKHVAIKYHFVTDCINNNNIKLEWISSEDQQADIFTKALGAIKHAKLKHLLMN